MNWLFLIIIAVLIIFAVRGWNRGFLRILYSLVSVIVLIGLMAYATPHISGFIKENTGVYESIQEKCSDFIQEKVEAGVESSVGQEPEKGTEVSLPNRVSSYIIGAGESALENSGVYDVVGSRAADWILSGASFLIALILSLIIVNAIGRALDIVNRIPLIKGVNRTLGIFAGLFQGFILIWIVFLFLALIAGTDAGGQCIHYINGNPFLKYLYYHNALLEIFSLIFR